MFAKKPYVVHIACIPLAHRSWGARKFPRGNLHSYRSGSEPQKYIDSKTI